MRILDNEVKAIQRMSFNFDRLLKDLIHEMDVPVFFGGEISNTYSREIESLGAAVLGTTHGEALDKMKAILPAFA